MTGDDLRGDIRTDDSGVPMRLSVAAEVAGYLRVSTRWVEDATREGRLPVIKIGRYRCYDPASIHRWMTEQARMPPDLR